MAAGSIDPGPQAQNIAAGSIFPVALFAFPQSIGVTSCFSFGEASIIFAGVQFAIAHDLGTAEYLRRKKQTPAKKYRHLLGYQLDKIT